MARTRLFFTAVFLLIGLLFALTDKASDDIIFSLAGILFSYFLWDGIIPFNHLYQNGPITEGMVVDYESHEEYNRAFIRYTTDKGQEHTGEAIVSFEPGINPANDPAHSFVAIVYHPTKSKQFVYFSDGVTILANSMAIVLTLGSSVAFFKHFDN